MKNPLDPRHAKRQKTVENLFKYQFHKQNITDYARKIIEKRDFLDQKIKLSAPEFPIEKINKTDLAILRLAVYEITIEKKQPEKVIIDEAIELAKEYGGEGSPAFIKGGLGKLIKNEYS
ncbi:MAG TPA: transcription antitermination protein NusB [Candidatus Sulfotelmatobacter sp.]|nr:transcription antitermination protein NusB [Candidatus Sulfotelmatobacter sp.]